MCAISEPERIVSANILSRRLGISRPVIARHIRRGVLRPDFTSGSRFFFRSERIPELRETITINQELRTNVRFLRS
jgi:hypothetical protein